MCVFSESSPGGHQVWQLQQGEIGSAPLRGAVPVPDHQGGRRAAACLLKQPSTCCTAAVLIIENEAAEHTHTP